jgi:hypothetical protein
LHAFQAAFKPVAGIGDEGEDGQVVHGPVIVRKRSIGSYFADTNDIQQLGNSAMALFSLLYFGFQFAALTIVLF